MAAVGVAGANGERMQGCMDKRGFEDLQVAPEAVCESILAQC